MRARLPSFWGRKRTVEEALPTWEVDGSLRQRQDAALGDALRLLHAPVADTTLVPSPRDYLGIPLCPGTQQAHADCRSRAEVDGDGTLNSLPQPNSEQRATAARARPLSFRTIRISDLVPAGCRPVSVEHCPFRPPIEQSPRGHGRSQPLRDQQGIPATSLMNVKWITQPRRYRMLCSREDTGACAAIGESWVTNHETARASSHPSDRSGGCMAPLRPRAIARHASDRISQHWIAPRVRGVSGSVPQGAECCRLRRRPQRRDRIPLGGR